MEDNKLGIGAFKFQSVVNNEMKLSKDPSSNIVRSRLRSEARKTIQEKCKFQFQNAKKKLLLKLQDPKEKEKLKDDVKKLSEEILEVNFLKQKQNEDIFQLQVSDTSSDSDSDGSIKLSTNHPLQEEAQAIQNLKGMVQNKWCKSLSNPKASPRESLTDVRKNAIKNKMGAIRQFKQPVIKKEIQFLRSLFQNQQMTNNQNLKVEEYKIDREIFVDMDCKDIMTFMRLQHEVEELRRKQMDFNKQKERHYEIADKNQIKKKKEESVKVEESKFWTIMMAKRFIKNMKLKKEQNSSQSIHHRKQSLIHKYNEDK